MLQFVFFGLPFLMSGLLIAAGAHYAAALAIGAFILWCIARALA